MKIYQVIVGRAGTLGQGSILLALSPQPSDGICDGIDLQLVLEIKLYNSYALDIK